MMDEKVMVDKRLAKKIALDCMTTIKKEKRKKSSREVILKKLTKMLKDGVDNAN